jgi:hypothetical protein
MQRGVAAAAQVAAVRLVRVGAAALVTSKCRHADSVCWTCFQRRDRALELHGVRAGVGCLVESSRTQTLEMRVPAQQRG